MRLLALFALSAGVLAAQQSAPAPREESLSPDRFREIHTPLLEPRQQGAAAELTEEVIGERHAEAPTAPLPRRTFIDEHIFGKIERAGIPHSPVASDAEFLRRVMLDLNGRIPAPGELREFLLDRDPNKRGKKIDELLARPAFEEKWAFFFMDLFRANGKMGRGRYLFHYWLKENLAADRSYDEMVRAIISASAKSNHVVAASNVIAREHVQGKAQPDDGRDLGMVQQLDTHDELSILYSKAFLGINLSCVSCHDGQSHLEKVNVWLSRRTRAEFVQNAAFFGHTRYLMYWEDGKPQSGEFLIDDHAPGYDTLGPSMLRVPRWGGPGDPVFILTGEAPRPEEEPREAFARMLTLHPQFARATVNLFWAQLMGMGIVEPYDEFDLARQDPENLPDGWTLQPTHPELLDELAADFRKHGHRLKHLFRRICNSTAYQLSARFPGEWHDNYREYFARKFVRMLTAEELHDAIVVATSRPGNYNFGDDAVGMAMQHADPVGKGDLKYLLRTFGQSTRRNPPKPATPSMLQPLVLLQSSVIGERVKADKDSRVQRLLDAYPENERVIDELYLATLTRRPSAGEREIALAALAEDRRRGAENLQWSLINSVEFFFNH